MTHPYTVSPNIVVAARLVNQGTADEVLLAELPPMPYRRYCIRLNVNGPVGSRLNVYLGARTDQNRVDSTDRGDVNTADYSGGPLEIPEYGTLIVEWRTGTLDPAIARTADATFHFRTS